MTTWLIAVSALVLFLSRRVAGQCNPLLDSCASMPGILNASYFVDFTKHSATPADWIQANYETVNYGSNGAEFSLAHKGDAPYMWTNAYFLFGRVDIVMQAAPGTGVVSSAVLMSDDLDEIDWEFSGNNFALSGGRVQTNYFGKGITGDYDRGTQPTVSDPTKAFHTYSLDWSASRLVWSVDGTVLRTLSYSPATSGAYQYPQTPMRLHLGLWDAGDLSQSQGVVQWAGGYTDLTKLPYTAYVRSVKITPSSLCAEYVYGDKSGSYQSVQCNNATLPITSSSSPSTLLPTTMTSFPVASSAISPTVIAPTNSSANSTSVSTSISTSTSTSTNMSTTTNAPPSLIIPMSMSTTSSMSVSQASHPSSSSTSSQFSLSSSTVTSSVGTTTPPAIPASFTSSLSATSTVSETSYSSTVSISLSFKAANTIPSGTSKPFSMSSSTSMAAITSSASTSTTIPASARVVIPTPTTSSSVSAVSALTPAATPKPSPKPTPMKCSLDNCLRNMLDPRYASSVTKFCSSWFAPATAPSDIPQVPPYLVGGCQNNFRRVSSACKCVPIPTAMATVTSGAKKRSINLVRALG